MKDETVLPAGPEQRNRSAVVSTILHLPIERPWRVTIEPYHPVRSDQQNRYLWGICYAKIMQHLEGWDAADVHEYMLGEWSGWETLEGFGRKRLRPIRRSSKLNKQEFSDFLDFVRRKASEIGIVIPDPDTAP